MARINDLDKAVARSGLPVNIQAGWKTRGRSGFRGAKGIICHHTAGPASGNYPSLNVVKNGRPGLRNALSHLGLGRDGSVYVIASGLCWHAGSGSWPGLRGNSDCIGIEAESTGRGDWTDAQVDAYPRLVAALKAHYNIPNSRVIAHFEWTSRKIDPYRFPGGMNAIRSGSAKPKPKPQPKEWWEMPIPKSELDKIAAAVHNYQVQYGNQKIEAGRALGRSALYSERGANPDRVAKAVWRWPANINGEIHGAHQTLVYAFQHAKRSADPDRVARAVWRWPAKVNGTVLGAQKILVYAFQHARNAAKK